MSLKTILKSIIADFHERGTPQTIKRDIYIPLDSNKVVTLIGPRRAGKTYMLYQLMEQIEDKTDILYINFEDERLTISPEELQLIIDSYFELYPKKKEQNIHIFFDEIQEVKEWEKFVRRIYDTITKRIFLTGSSAKMLSREIATSLRGRAISYEIYPLSFKEYLSFKKIPLDIVSTKGKAAIMHEFDNYLLKGGFPETVLMEEEAYTKTITSYFDVMLYRDVIERHSIPNSSSVRELLKHLLSQSAKEFSINKIYNDLKSQGLKVSKDSLYSYLGHFEDAFIILPVQNYSGSVRKQTLRKSYAVDTGLARMLSFSLNKDYGRLLETLVLLELKRRGKLIFYFKSETECDFIIKERNTINEAIQVCYELNEDNKKREINGLKNAMKQFKLTRGIIITRDARGQEENIAIMPIIDWLLGV